MIVGVAPLGTLARLCGRLSFGTGDGTNFLAFFATPAAALPAALVTAPATTSATRPIASVGNARGLIPSTLEPAPVTSMLRPVNWFGPRSMSISRA